MGKTVATEVTQHEKGNMIRAREDELKKKYRSNIANFCHHHNVDLGIGWAMLLFNAKCFAKGVKGEVVPGGGTINVPELVKDYNDLMKFNAGVGMEL